jgi:hypothetical protein
MMHAALLGAGAVLMYGMNRGPKNLVEVRSTTDQNVYRVQNLPDKQAACNKMAEIRGRLEKLIEHYRSDPASAADPRVKVMISRFNPENMCENDLDSDTTSYSENKGEKIVVCLRDKSPPYNIADTNTIMFVILHEMAHLMTTTVGHTPEFWTNFRRILQDSVSIQIYQQVNYSRTPVSYCGMTITDSPI